MAHLGQYGGSRYGERLRAWTRSENKTTLNYLSIFAMKSNREGVKRVSVKIERVVYNETMRWTRFLQSLSTRPTSSSHSFNPFGQSQNVLTWVSIVFVLAAWEYTEIDAFESWSEIKHAHKLRFTRKTST